MTVAREVDGRPRRRRKEVALRRLRTLTFLLALGAWGLATDGTPPVDAATSPDPADRPPAPVPPIEYLKAGAKLYNAHDPRAVQYLKAARDYQDQLTPDQQATLNQYLNALEGGSSPASTTPPATVGGAAASSPPTAARDQAVALVTQARQALAHGQVDEARRLALQADGLNVAFEPAEDSPARILAEAESARVAPVTRRSSSGDKQRATWLVLAAREHIHRGQYDEAAAKLAEADSMNVHWGLFDVTPTKVAHELERARPKATAATKTNAGKPDRQMAKGRLEQARAALAAGRYDQAETIALEVGSWGLTFGFFEDNPSKVAAAARSLRQRDAARRAGPQTQPSQEIYALLVRDARQLMAAGRYDEAKTKALEAQRMNPVLPLDADRADAVLHDLAMIGQRSQQAGAVAAAQPAQAPTPNPLPASDPQVQQVGISEPIGPDYSDLQPELSPLPVAPDQAQPDQLVLNEPNPADPGQPQPIQLESIPGEPLAGENAPAEPEMTIPELGQTEVAPAEAAADEPFPAQAEPVEPMSPEEATLAQARQLLQQGNYAGARQLTTQARGTEADQLLAEINYAEQAAVLPLYDAALDAVRKTDYGRARALLAEVASSEIAMSDESMAQKVQDLLLRLPQEGAGQAQATDLVDAQTEAEIIEAQRWNAEVGTKLAEHRRLMETDPARAIELLQAQRDAVQKAQIHETAKKTLDRRLQVAIEMAQRDKVKFDQKMQDKQARIEIEQKKLRIMEADKAKHERMDELMKRATEAMAAGKYEEAEAAAKLAMEVNPNDPTPAAIAWKARAEGSYKRNLEISQEKDRSFTSAMLDVDQSAIIPRGLLDNGVSYPKSFAQMSQRRAGKYDLYPRKSIQTLEIEKKLNDPITINFQKASLNEVADFISMSTGLNVVIDPKALIEESVTSASTVTLKLNEVKLRQVLKLLLGPLNLTYKEDDGVLLITSPQSKRTDLVQRVYDVADLVIGPDRGPSEANQQQGNGATSGGTTIPDPNNPFGPPIPVGNSMSPAGNGEFDSGGSGPKAVAGGRQNVDMMPLIQLITTSIAPGSWKIHDPNGDADSSGGYGLGQGAGFGLGGPGAAGGGLGGLNDQPVPPGSITPFYLSISLIIRHTPEVHEQIVDLLRQLRRLQDLQISVEVRFITVDDSYFEQIGVDFDFSIQYDGSGPKSSFAVANPAVAFPGGGATTATTATTSSTTAPYLINPLRDHALGSQVQTVGLSSGGIASFTPDLSIPFIQNSATNIAPFNAIGPAATTFGIAFLSDLEMYLFLTAIQGDTRNNIVQAPKVTSFNGATATIFNATRINYVAALIPVVNAGAVAFQPQVSAINDGVQLSVTPVISADRRYVRMSLTPTFTTFTRFDTFPIPAAVGGGGLGGGAAAIQGQIQIPVFSQTIVSTTVTVPDGGTVLLGGVKRLREQRVEFGTPILAKLPYINRLFRNIGIGRTTDSLMLMVTPRIIILEEEEERLGIPAVPTVTF